MKKKNYLYIISLAFILSYQQSNAQYNLLEADKAYIQFNFVKAIDLYEQAYQKKATLHAAERLAKSYHAQRNYKQTESWAAIAANMPNAKPEHVLFYAKALQANSKFNEAKTQYLKYANLTPDLDSSLKNTWIESCDSAIKWMNNPRNFIVKNEVELNSPQSDWGAFIQNNSIVFASDRNNVNDVQKNNTPFLRFDAVKGPNKGIYTWTGNHYLRIFIKRGTDSVQMYPINAGTEYHVGPATFTADNTEAFFTVTRLTEQLNYDKNKEINAKVGTIRVEIFSLTKDSKTGIWSTNPIPFKYNNIKKYSVIDPFISPDGKSLYFASNMEGGKGELDLYVCHKNINGEWDAPINLGDVNTAGNDRSPSIGANGKFYFASNGRVGLGGLDIFRATINGNSITNPENLGYPLNSPHDDFSFLLLQNNTGYFSSNRDGGLGNDDIYSFIEQVKIDVSLAGKAFDKKTNEALPNTIVTLTKDNGANLKVQTDEQGNFKFNLEKDVDYNLLGEKTNYRNDVLSFNTKNLTSSTVINKNLFLELIEQDKAIRLENIYYDFDKANIRPDAAIELDKLVKIMVDNPTIWIELSSHTDSRGNDQYNQQLSQRRAESAVNYIISRGINKNRITAKGYGESQLLNKCANGVKCTKEQHQLNRRTEFKITKQ